MSTHGKKGVDPAHAIVYRDIPADEFSKRMLAHHMDRLSRLYYITITESQTGGKMDYIIEFPNSNPEVVFAQLRKIRDFHGCQPCSYPQYAQHAVQPTSTPSEEKLPEAKAPVPETPPQTPSRNVGGQFQSAEYEADISDTFDILEWTTEVRRKPGKITYMKRRKETRCEKGDHCPDASDCPYLHTEDEGKLFAKLPKNKLQFFKIKECSKKDQHVTPEQKRGCPFAHDNQDSWCLDCKMYGHLTENCQVKK